MLKGEAFDTTAGRELRRKADEFAPNPETAHKADQILHGVVRGASKAVFDVATMGPVAGPVAFGIDEGNTAAQRLIDQGVDPATAAKVGVTTGIVQGASVALPVVGSTIPKTIGLALAGGPVSYMAQEKAAKEILKRADYSDIASQHDPFDPLGLGLSVVIPGAVAGLHVRGLTKARSVEDVVKHIESGGNRFDANGNLLTSPKGAQGEMQVMPGTATDPGFGVVPAKDNSPAELARVGRDYLAAMQQKYGDTDKALAAYNAGPGAVDKAVAAHGEKWLDHLPEETQKYVAKANRLLGEHIADKGAADPAVVDAARVRTLDSALARGLPDHPEASAFVMHATDEIAAGRLPNLPDLSAAAERVRIESEISEAEARYAELLPTAANLADHGAVREARQELDLLEQSRPDISPARTQELAKEIQASEGTGYKAALAEASKRLAGQLADFEGRVANVRRLIESNAEAQHATEEAGSLEARLAGLRARRDALPPDLTPSPIAIAANQAIAMPTSSPLGLPHFAREPAGERPPSTLPPADSPTIEPETAKAPSTNPVGGAVDQARLKQLLEEQPHLEDAILRAHEAYDEEVSLADLVKIAAECALANGG
jgi:hypothetical protein